jgi:hypothetical protein
MSCLLDDCLKARYDENVRRHCGQRLVNVDVDEANRRNEVKAAELEAAMVDVADTRQDKKNTKVLPATSPLLGCKCRVVKDGKACRVV